ncbi:hypothetical protein [Ruminococcus sp. HUN007]|uniref:hypothetical protein n=1 Tax=Ruminococcus sp. HUN007 TaxID=1514668 RepID=UPI0005D22E7D|nr:hypothetical protein [Ruminococcus sp. HUN007]
MTCLRRTLFFYKSGLLILSGKGEELEKEIKHIDRIAEVTDHFVIRGEIKKALLYAALLRRKVNDYIEKVSSTDLELPAGE